MFAPVQNFAVFYLQNIRQGQIEARHTIFFHTGDTRTQGRYTACYLSFITITLFRLCTLYCTYKYRYIWDSSLYNDKQKTKIWRRKTNYYRLETQLYPYVLTLESS